jgi:hypothetical protein
LSFIISSLFVKISKTYCTQFAQYGYSVGFYLPLADSSMRSNTGTVSLSLLSKSGRRMVHSIALAEEVTAAARQQKSFERVLVS